MNTFGSEKSAKLVYWKIYSGFILLKVEFINADNSNGVRSQKLLRRYLALGYIARNLAGHIHGYITVQLYIVTNTWLYSH